MKAEVFFAVVEVVFEFAAGVELVVRGYRDVTGIEKAVNVGSKKQAVIYAVFTLFSDGTNVSGFESGRAFSCVTAHCR